MSSGWIGDKFSISINMSANRAAGIGFVASTFARQHDIIEVGINNLINKDGDNVPTADLPMNGFGFTNVGAAATTRSYLDVDTYLRGYPIYMVDNGGLFGFSISTSPGYWPASASAGAVAYVAVATAKPTASSINILLHIGDSSVGTTIEIDGRVPMTPNAVQPGRIYKFIRNDEHYQTGGFRYGEFSITPEVYTSNRNTSNLLTSAVSGTPYIKGYTENGMVNIMLYTGVVEAKQSNSYYIYSGIPEWAWAPTQQMHHPLAVGYLISATSAMDVAFRVETSAGKIMLRPNSGLPLTPNLDMGMRGYLTIRYPLASA